MALNISFMGGDSRLFYALQKILIMPAFADYSIKCFHLSYPENALEQLIKLHPHRITICRNMSQLFEDCKMLICPVPFTRDGIQVYTEDTSETISIPDFMSHETLPEQIIGGGFPKYFIHSISQSSTKIYDIMKDDSFVAKNAELTGEGLLKYMIGNTPVTISHAHILIAGYGRCGKVIAEKLSVLEGNITILDHDDTAIRTASEKGYTVFDPKKFDGSPLPFDMIVNTIPTPVLKAPLLRKLKGSCRIFDIASSPGGFDEDVCKGLSLKVIKCPGIPGKTAPASAGYAIAECAERFFISS